MGLHPLLIAPTSMFSFALKPFGLTQTSSLVCDGEVNWGKDVTWHGQGCRGPTFDSHWHLFGWRKTKVIQGFDLVLGIVIWVEGDWNGTSTLSSGLWFVEGKLKESKNLKKAWCAWSRVYVKSWKVWIQNLLVVNFDWFTMEESISTHIIPFLIRYKGWSRHLLAYACSENWKLIILNIL